MQSPVTTAWQAILSPSANPFAKRTSTDVGALRFSAPETTRTLQRAQTPTPPQLLPRGAPALRATSSRVSSARASAARPRGVNVTSLDGLFTASSHARTKLSFVSSVYYSMRTQSRMNDENRIAEEILRVLPADIARACSPEKHLIRYTVVAEGLKLRTIVFSRESLRRLLEDPARDVKIEYLQRDLIRTAAWRSEFRYPRQHVHGVPALPRRLAFRYPLASGV